MKMTLNTLFDYVNNDGIFTYLNENNVPWKNVIDADLLDLDYHSKHGTKIITKTVTSLLTETGLSNAAKSKLARLIFLKYNIKWTSLWESQDLYDEFNPLDNTDWEETITTTHQGGDSKTQNIGTKTSSFVKGSQTDSITIGEQTTEEGAQTNTIGNQSNTSQSNRSALNSNNYSPVTQEVDSIGNRSDTIGAKQTTVGDRSDSSTEGQRTDTTTDSAQINTETNTDQYTDTVTTSRHGNIGVTTSGALIRDFRDVVDWTIFETIYNDINNVLVLEIYGCDDEDLDDYTINTNYILPIASATKLGGIKIGDNLAIDSNGILRATPPSYNLPIASNETLGGVKIGLNLSIDENGVLNATGGSLVDSVNGKQGIVILNASDVGAATQSDISTAISNVNQVPSGGETNQILTKLADGYGWANSSGGSGSIKSVSIVSDPVYSNGNSQAVGFNRDGVLQVNSSSSGAYNYTENIDEGVDWIEKRGPNFFNGGKLIYDDEIVAVIPYNNTNTFKYINELSVLTTKSDYSNNVITHNLEFLDVANATYDLTINREINHIMISIVQYNGYNNNRLTVKYVDNSDVEHDISSLVTTKIYPNSDSMSYLATVSYDIDDYVKNLQLISASGYRTRVNVFYN